MRRFVFGKEEQNTLNDALIEAIGFSILVSKQALEKGDINRQNEYLEKGAKYKKMLEKFTGKTYEIN